MGIALVVAMGLAGRLLLVLVLASMLAGAVASSEVVRLEDEKQQLGASAKDEPTDEEDDDYDDHDGDEGGSDTGSGDIHTEGTQGATTTDEDPHAAELLSCQQRSAENEKKMLTFQTASAECAQKLEEAELNLVKAERKATEEESLRANAILETSKAVEEEKKAIALAEHEKTLRGQADQSCQSRMGVLQEANDNALADKEAKAEAHAKKLEEQESAIRLKAEEEKTALVAKLNQEREDAIQAVMDAREKALQSIKEESDAKIKAAEDNVKAAEQADEASAALSVAQKKAALEAQVQNAEAERDDALKRVSDLKAEIEAAKKSSEAAAEARAAVENDLAEYKAWAEQQLAKARDAAQDATNAAAGASAALNAAGGDGANVSA